MPNENRVSQSYEGKTEIIKYPGFSKEKDGNGFQIFTSKFPIINGKVDKIVFLDLKFQYDPTGGQIDPWSFDKKINGITRVLTPDASEVGISMEYTQVGDMYQNGKVTLTLAGPDSVLKEINKNLQRVGTYSSDYCMVLNCPGSSKFVRSKTILSSREGKLVVEIPVTSLTKSISFIPYFQINNPNQPKFKVSNELNGWENSILLDGKQLRITRKNESTNLGVYLKNVNTSTGQQNLEILINGIGDNTANLIRNLRTVGLTRVNMVGDKETLNIVKPVINYRNGQGVFSITALKNTKSFILPTKVGDISSVNLDINPVPSNWKVVSDGKGIERTSMGVSSVIRVVSTPIAGSTDTNFNFTVLAGKSDMEKVLSTLENDGVTVTKCTGDEKCFYPVQKIKGAACGDYLTAGCKFSVRVPNDATMIYFNYKQGNSVSSDMKLLPKGWRAAENGTGLNKF